MAADHFIRVPALACLLTLTASGCSGASGPPPAGTPSSTHTKAAETSVRTVPTPKTTTTPARPGAVTKVLVFVEENHSLDEMSAGMPYTFGLARRFGYATHYRAVAHPSLPNYIAIAGGQTYEITNDDPPAANPVRGPSVFGQAVASGRTAGLYAEGMARNCATSDGGSSAGGSSYAVKHNPWAYFLNAQGVDERAACRKYDLPIDQLGGVIAGGRLPNVGMVIPNLCHDGHNCPLGTADTWLKGWMTKVFQGQDWKSGHLAVVLTADEDDRSAGNTVLTVVIHPSQKGHVVTTALTHYSLTRLYEDAAGMPYLFGAASAPSMDSAFGLPLS